MAENTKIEWADHTFSPWTGCTKVSPACDHCYAEGWAKRSGHVKWGSGQPRRRTSDANWRMPIKWNREAERTGVRPRVFCASLADVFDNAIPDAWRMDLFSLIAKTPYLDWLLVTKRVGNVMRMCSGDGLMFDMIADRVWLGVTICNQEEADRDIPKLLATPAPVRFLSMEPLLGPVELSNVTRRSDCVSQLGKPAMKGIDWVIVGGESGPKARPMHPAWARDIRDQCEAAGVAFFFKQWGGWGADGVRRARHANGRLLAGRTWDAYPEPAGALI